MFKEGQNRIEGEDRPDRPIMVSTPEMLDSVNVLILADRRVRIEEIYEQLKISVGTVINSRTRINL